MVEEMLNKVKPQNLRKYKVKNCKKLKIRKDANEVTQKEFCKIYCKASIIII